MPIKNEAANLTQCLERLAQFAEVVVVDSGSTDDSLKLAGTYDTKVVEFQWDGRFPKKRNWCLLNYPFQTEWVLFLDADEYVTPEFVTEVATAIKDSTYNGFWVTYQNYFMDRLLRYGDKLRKLPLVRLGCGEYEYIAEEMWTSLDMEVHEHLIIKGSVGYIKAPIIHKDFKSLAAYYDRHNKYSSWEAARFATLSNTQRGNFTLRQKIKYRLLASAWLPVLYFIGSYILKLGFLDGRAGFQFCISKMFYFYQINFKIVEKHIDKG